MHNFAKGTATPFYTQPFSGGIPAGWTAASLTSGTGTWRWANAATSGTLNPFSIGAINSTTASNGWMLYNSDSLGSVNGNVAPFSGTLTSATISCAGHPSVKVTFQQWFRRFQDSCFVDVSNDNGVTWTAFGVQPNNTISSNTNLPANPTITSINISSVAANQANVKVRFRYICLAAGGSFNWLVDDMAMSELDPIDLGIAKSGMLMPTGTSSLTANYGAFTSIPLQLVDSLLPITFLTNKGSSAGTATVVNVKIFNGTSQVYSQNITYNIPVNGMDSIITYDANLYRPTAVGNYTAVFSINPTGDVNTTDNQDTVRFAVTDSVYNTYGPTLSGSYYLHRPAATGVTEISYDLGARFSIPDGRTDTITAITAVFASGTTVGAQVQAQLYKANDDGSGGFTWAGVARSATLTIASGNVSTSTSLVQTRLPLIGVGTAITNLKLTGGDYAVIITPVGASSQTILLNAAVAPFAGSPVGTGYIGRIDTSANNITYSFGSSSNTNFAAVPLVGAVFGRYMHVSVGTIPGITVGEVYPNPANTFINVPVTVKESTNVSVTISNVTGQVVRTQNMGTIAAGNMSIASINTADLANGVYIYTINANGGRIAGRIVVSH